MLKVTMYSSADKVKGQGVGSAYVELVRLLKARFKGEFDIAINKYRKSDISHYHTIDPQFYLSTFSHNRGRKIGYVHFLPETLDESLNIPQPFRSIFYHYVIAFYKRMDHLVVVNPSFIHKLVAYGIPEDKITYIPNFVDSDRFYEMSAQERINLRQKFHLKRDDFVVLGSGQIQERKGVPDFIKLARQNLDIQFIWAGGFSFGRMTDGYKELKRVVDNPPANLIFTGIVSRDEIAQLNNLADLFLLPSYNELFPMSVLEAFSCGTPVMLRDLDLYHAIIDGYYQPAKDVDEMQAELRKLREDPERLQMLKKLAHEAAYRYSKDHLAKIWHRFYLEQAKER